MLIVVLYSYFDVMVCVLCWRRMEGGRNSYCILVGIPFVYPLDVDEGMGEGTLNV